MALPFLYQKEFWALLPTEPKQDRRTLKIHGVALTQAGKELLDIVEIEPFESYHVKLVEFFTSMKLAFTKVKVQ